MNHTVLGLIMTTVMLFQYANGMGEAQLPVQEKADTKTQTYTIAAPMAATTQAAQTVSSSAEAIAKTMESKIQPVKPLAINAWGDSITAGSGSDGLTYPDVLEQLTGIETNNYGIGGETSLEILERSLDYGSQADEVLIIQMGDNGGWDDLDELIDQYRQLIEEADTDQYIIISSTDDPDDYEQIWGYTDEEIGLEDTWYESAYREVFGDHLFIGRKYLIQYGLEINDLEASEEDVARAEEGNISLQLRNPDIDNTHLNEAGYTALAYGVYEKGVELGYW